MIEFLKKWAEWLKEPTKPSQQTKYYNDANTGACCGQYLANTVVDDIIAKYVPLAVEQIKSTKVKTLKPKKKATKRKAVIVEGDVYVKDDAATRANRKKKPVVKKGPKT